MKPKPTKKEMLFDTGLLSKEPTGKAKRPPIKQNEKEITVDPHARNEPKVTNDLFTVVLLGSFLGVGQPQVQAG